MQTYDVIMLLVLAGCTMFGFWKGMAWQLASVASLVVSYFVSLNFSDKLAPYISAEAPWNRYAAMLALYLGTSMGVWFLFRVVASVIDKVKLKEFDHQVGALIGVAKGVLLCMVITFFAVTLSERARDVVLPSRSGHYISALIAKADPLLPDDLYEVIGPYLEKLDEKLHGGGEPDDFFSAETAPTGRQRTDRAEPAEDLENPFGRPQPNPFNGNRASNIKWQ